MSSKEVDSGVSDGFASDGPLIEAVVSLSKIDEGTEDLMRRLSSSYRRSLPSPSDSSDSVFSTDTDVSVVMSDSPLSDNSPSVKPRLDLTQSLQKAVHLTSYSSEQVNCAHHAHLLIIHFY